MAKTCTCCGEPLAWPFSCHFCPGAFCADHRLPEKHDCPPVIAAKYVRKDMLREKNINITTASFRAACDQCNYTSEYVDIVEAYHKRRDHIRDNGCSSEKIWLERHPENVADDRNQGEGPWVSAPVPNGGASTSATKIDDWMYDCLADAKDVIKKFHSPYCDCNAESFFRNTTYQLYIQNDKQSAYAYIGITPGSSHFRIGVHPALSEKTPYYQKALVVVFVHELLHAIHQDWGHGKINPQERLLANKAGYFDALVELERLAFNGKMRVCYNN